MLILIYCRRVNEIFAEKTLEALRNELEKTPGQIPLIWIHDYHLVMTTQNYLGCIFNKTVWFLGPDEVLGWKN